MKRKRLELFLEFLIFGLLMGLIEDLIAVKIASGEPITWNVVFVVALVAIPFAVIGELIVDRTHLFQSFPSKKTSSKKSSLASKSFLNKFFPKKSSKK
ncbi:MAG: hypothetical protein ACQESC_01280 [Nanobdellota archaeon]